MSTSEFTDRLLQGLHLAAEAPEGRRLVDYFEGKGDPVPYAGSRFETYRPSDPGAIEPADLLAVTFLSIQITLKRGLTPAAILRLDRDRATISELLQQIPTGRPLGDLSSDEFETHLGSDSPATRLYELLRGLGLGRVTTYKLLARKRPELLPIRDSVMESVVGKSKPWWKPWWEAMQDPAVLAAIDSLKSDAGSHAKDLSRLRVADIALWMSHH
ncbi:MAG: hypothetical protein JJE52_01520 [Acidimicrobiia bacterium]|nr:hypothetical protein [Acidimicrobiia bacterium]